MAPPDNPESFNDKEPFEGDQGYLPYLQTDVATLVFMVNTSKDSARIVGALVVHEEENTIESYNRSQLLLKRVLQKELVEEASGCVRPKLNRLANLVFFTQDARLDLDEDDLPVFRPGSADDSVLALNLAVSEGILKAAKEKSMEQEVPRSVRLLEQIIGFGTEEEVKSLRSLASLAKKVQEELGLKKEEIFESFKVAAEGTTDEELEKEKSELQARLKDLELVLGERDGEKQSTTQSLEELEGGLLDLLNTLDMESESFNIDDIVGEGNDNFDVVLKALKDQYEMMANREKASNEANASANDYEAQRLRLEAILKTNTEDRDDTEGIINEIAKSISESTDERTLKLAEKNTEEGKMSTQNQKGVAANQKKSKLTALQDTELNTIWNIVNVKENELRRIGAFVSVTKLRRYSHDLYNSTTAINTLTATKGQCSQTLNNKRTKEGSAKRQLTRQ